jgi:hypothetical protein
MVVPASHPTIHYREVIITCAIVHLGKNVSVPRGILNFLPTSLSLTGLYCQERDQCPPTFYGPNCTVQCTAANSCSQGHFACNAKGERVCLYGWGPINQCTQKLIAPIFDTDCSTSSGCLNGGSCFNGSCCCPAGYTGKKPVHYRT